jgi:hypothetical protein
MHRAADIEHREWMICLGRGFDFLHMPNIALIVGPYSPELAEPVGRPAAIIEANMAKGRIPDDGFLLLASVPYEELGVDSARAGLKSAFLADFAAGVIARQSPALAGKMHVRTAVLDWRSRRSMQQQPRVQHVPVMPVISNAGGDAVRLLVVNIHFNNDDRSTRIALADDRYTHHRPDPFERFTNTLLAYVAAEPCQHYLLHRYSFPLVLLAAGSSASTHPPPSAR